MFSTAHTLGENTNNFRDWAPILQSEHSSGIVPYSTVREQWKQFLSGMLWVGGVPFASCVLLERCWSSSLEEKRSCSLPDVRLLSPSKLHLQKRDSPFQVSL